MQKLSMPYDSFCMNEECIQQKASFFQFDAQNQHIANNHNVKSLHPLTFASYFSKDGKASTTINAQQLNEQLERTRKQSFQSVVQAVRKLFYDDRLFHALAKQLPLCQDLSIKTILAKLGQQDYQLLQHLRLFELQQRQRNFKTYLYSYINYMQQQLKAHFDNLKKTILLTCQVLQYPHQSPPQAVPVQNKQPDQAIQIMHRKPQKTKDLQQEITPPSVPEPNKEISVKLEYVPVNYQAFGNKNNLKQEQMEYEIDDDQDEEQNEAAQKSQAGIEKSKPISKQSSHTKSQKKRRKNYILTDGIQILSQEEVIINQSRYPLKTLSFLEEKLPLLTTIHIFHETMAKQALIKKIIATFYRIKRVTINCTFDFQSSIFRQIQHQIPINFTIDLKWDMSKFFTEYYAYKYFPFRSMRRIERSRQIDMQQLHNLIAGNNSLWHRDSYCSNWLNTQDPSRFANITTLRASISTIDAAYTKQIKHLKVLILLEGFMFYASYSRFCRIVNQNPQLETIIFSHSFQFTNQFLVKMKQLPKLSKLSVNNCRGLVNPQDLFSLVHLTHLNIEGLTLSYDQEQRPYSNFRKLMNLKNLKHFSFYASRIKPQQESHSFLQGKQIESDVLMYLSSRVTNSLVYLNLGKTKVNNNACQYIKKMTSLKYLNIDETQIEGQSLIDAFKHMARQSFLDVPLKHLSMQGNANQYQGNSISYFTQQNLIEMSKYLKKLSYLNVAFVESIKTYNFADFKALKTIALSEKQLDSLDLLISPEVNRYKIKQQT